MTDLLLVLRYLYKKVFPDDRKQFFDRLPDDVDHPSKATSMYGGKPIVLSVESGEIKQREINLMQAAWEENMIKPSSDNFWEPCGFSDAGDGNYLCFDNIDGSSRTATEGRKIPKTVKLLNLAKTLLTELDIPFSDKDHYIEFHHSRVSSKGMVVPKFHWHIDDGGAVNYNSVAVLFYVYKDSDMIGGNLFWNPDGEHDNGKQLINIETGTVVIMPGNTPHCPEVIQYGFSDPRNTPKERKLIVFFFRDLSR